jgi:hypothetical protein
VLRVIYDYSNGCYSSGPSTAQRYLREFWHPDTEMWRLIFLFLPDYCLIFSGGDTNKRSEFRLDSEDKPPLEVSQSQYNCPYFQKMYVFF